eukprot:310092-Chlamydomonas_euryale.AAC.1
MSHTRCCKWLNRSCASASTLASSASLRCNSSGVSVRGAPGIAGGGAARVSHRGAPGATGATDEGPDTDACPSLPPLPPPTRPFDARNAKSRPPSNAAMPPASCRLRLSMSSPDAPLSTASGVITRPS